jgi:uncharacterized protein
MTYKFHAYGHKNITARHKTTLEFTKDKELTLKGDCIVGVNADFELEKIKEFIKKSKNLNIKITLESENNIKESISAKLNPNFNDDKELVIRKTEFVSDRTIATSSDKASNDLNKELINLLRKNKSKITLILENKAK